MRGSKKDAEKELRKRLTALDEGRHVDASRMTVGEWLGAWLAAIKPEVSPKTHHRYEELCRHYLIATFGTTPLQKLTSLAIQAAYAGWAEGGRRDGRPGGLAPRTRRHIHRVLYSALTRAMEHEPPLLARNPAGAFRKRLPKVERKDMVTLTASQGVELLEALRHSRMYWPVLLALATGMRRGEICALRWRSIDLDRGTVRVVESLEQVRKAIRFKPTKTDKARAIKLPAFAQDALRRWKRAQAEELLGLGIRQTGDTLVCGRADGEPHLPQSITFEFNRFMARLALPRVTFHGLRHSHARNCWPRASTPRLPRSGWATRPLGRPLTFTPT